LYELLTTSCMGWWEGRTSSGARI